MSLAAAQVKAIGSAEYKVLPLPAMTSLRVLTRVLKMTAPAFADVSSLRDAASAMGAFLSAGIMELDEAVIVYLCEEFAKVTTVVQGSRALPLADIFDEHFRGRVNDLFAWLRFAAEVTYGPLGEALKGAMGAVPEAAEKPTPAPSATPGG